MLALTVVGLSPWLAAICIVMVLIGSLLQASIGIGVGLVSAPVLGIIDPDFLPTGIIIGVIPLGIGVAMREREHIDSTGMSYAVAGRIPGSLIGGWIAANSSHRVIALIVGCAVLIAVFGSLTGIRFSPTNRNLLIAGTASGFAGTATGIGGPPMAITYQHSDPGVMRATLASFFVFGAVVSIIVLSINGVLGERQLQLAFLLVPGVLAGLWISRYTVGHLPAERLRPIVLVVCSISAIVLLLQELT